MSIRSEMHCSLKFNTLKFILPLISLLKTTAGNQFEVDGILKNKVLDFIYRLKI